MAVWQCRLLLGIVLVHLALSSPLVRRDVLSLDHEPQPNPLAEVPVETLGEDAFGPTLNSRGGREKRLLKTLGLGALGVKAAKAVGAKVVTTGAKALGVTALKAGAAVKAAATGAIGLKAKAIGLKTVTAVAALGIKALIFKLLFGKINQFITQKEKLLNQLDQYNKEQNEKFSKQLFGTPCHTPAEAPVVAPPINSDGSGVPGTLPDSFPTITDGGFSPDPLPQLSKSSLQPRRMPATTAAPSTGGDDQIPDFDPNKISLQVPDELFAPAFNSVNSISTVIGNLIQGTAERVARLVERMKPLLQSSLGFRSRKRQTEKEEVPLDNETTFFTESDSSASKDEEYASNSSETLSSKSADESSPIKTSYAALSENS